MACCCLSLVQPHTVFADHSGWFCASNQVCYDDMDCANNPNGGNKGVCEKNGDVCQDYIGGVPSTMGLCIYEADDSGGGGGGYSSSCGAVDSNGCANDDNISSVSCYGRSLSYKGGQIVFYPTAGGVARNQVDTYLNSYTNPDGSSYGIYNGSWASQYAGYAKFCYCEESECNGIVTVRPLANGNSTDCIDGYHWESNKGCVVDKTCSDCTSTNWLSYNTGYQRRTVKTCNVSTGNCSSTYEYRCAAGWYGSSSNGTSGCTRCPDLNGVYGSSTAGSKYITSCYIPSNTVMSDATGSMVFTNNCYYPSGTVGS